MSDGQQPFRRRATDRLPPDAQHGLLIVDAEARERAARAETLWEKHIADCDARQTRIEGALSEIKGGMQLLHDRISSVKDDANKQVTDFLKWACVGLLGLVGVLFAKTMGWF